MKREWDYRVIVTSIDEDLSSLEFTIGRVNYEDGKAVSWDYVAEIDDTPTLEMLTERYKDSEFKEAFDKPAIWGHIIDDEGEQSFPAEYKPLSRVFTEMVDQTIGRYNQSEFVTPLSEFDKAIFAKCPNCGHQHFRHAGYFIQIAVGAENTEGPKLGEAQESNYICVKCKHSYIFSKGRIVDTTQAVDLNAWEKLEVTAQRMTGPGGQC